MQSAPAPRRSRRRPRLVLAVVATLAVVGSLLWHRPDPVAASAGDEAAFVAALNRVRADNGLPAFTVNAELSDLSRAHAQVMADAGEIFHADPISEGYSGQWSKIGENVGVGANVEVLVDAFVASAGHYANIVDPAFTQIGVGVVWKDSALYTTHRFLQVPGAPTTAPPTTAPPTTAPPTTVPPTTVPTTTPPTAAPTTAPPTTPTVPAPSTSPTPLPAPAITAERVVALLEMLEQVGT